MYRRARRLAHLALPVLGLLALLAGPAAAADRDYVSGELIARFDGQRVGKTIELPEGVGVRPAAAALGSNPNVRYAVPNYIATASGLPNDPGTIPPAGGPAGGWANLQWNFLPCGSFCAPGSPPQAHQSPGGINAPGAWKNLRKAGVPGARGLVVAVLDTGIAYRDLGTKFKRSPDFGANQFVPGYDFVGNDPLPLDVNGHGTHLAGTIAEKTNNHI